ncbi:DUF2520 domain-containing protein [Dysgonomonas sp. 521]|uniref:Rossmann-like and DUF2520 domain-containing protein n=1 Tax=Dysgonomonas sp. 521 TaxID=2302932 RepID=UPI0013D3E5B2|nr:Rossmann-like and DUF2520 domain-containing protein [Dysgonomonas sp. 521]NDV96509.1 DUF2520 domain-containing protein [Dysgonomonas sp. 521]
MKVVFIGAGNVATQLANVLYDKSFDIIQVYSRTIESASALAREVQAVAVTDIASVISDADLYIFSVKDSVLAELISRLPSNNGLWIHTAGSMPMDIFEGYQSRYGVLYPFQTFSKERSIDWSTVPFFIEASDAGSLQLLKAIASQLSGKVTELSTEDRKYLHLTGVFACNFTNHMYVLSKQILEKINLPFDVALPLIGETADKVHSLSPEKAQTGPAVRYDENVISKHLSLIEDEKIKQIYKLISEDIHRFSK